jgi:hypothetical protein
VPVIELQASDACYSWRLPPPRWLGGVISVEAHKKLVRCSGEELYEGHCARPTGATKSNSSKARREGRQVVRPGQVLELVVSIPHGRV